MSESKHRALPGVGANAGREGRAEALLVEGLDQYFLGNFEEAIHLWTRVLFIDRTHARARAYINRARTAQGERLRRAEEMLHAAAELLDHGRLDEARHVLNRVEQTSGADETVAALWARIEQLTRSRVDAPARRPRGAVVDARPLRGGQHLFRLAAQAAAVAAIGLFIASVLASPAVREWIASRPASPTPPATSPRPLDVLSSDAVALVRARNLFARGRLAEALHELGRIDSSSPSREAADQLRVEIQRWLLMPRQATVAGSPLAEGQP
jgi:tetratricopeptide (TPR) repeat protein